MPAPRISVKIVYFLTDVSEGGRGNFSVIPGSHLVDEVEYPADGVSNPPDAHEVQVPAGTAVIFDRRIWHAGWVEFLGYYAKGAVRWLQYAMVPSERCDDCLSLHGSVRSNSASVTRIETGNLGLTSPKNEDVPLREWMREHIGEEAIADRSVRNLT